MALRKLYFVADIAARYGKSEETARRYMRAMGATGAPLFVTEDMITDWESEHRKEPRKAKRKWVTPPPGKMVIPGKKTG